MTPVLDDQIKATVDLRILAPQWAVAYPIIHYIFRSRGYACVLTSGNDSHEDKPNSKHHTGEALDFRTRHVPVVDKTLVHQAVQTALGPQWDVLLENVGKDTEHLHVEFDPKTEPKPIPEA